MGATPPSSGSKAAADVIDVRVEEVRAKEAGPKEARPKEARADSGTQGGKASPDAKASPNAKTSHAKASRGGRAKAFSAAPPARKIGRVKRRRKKKRTRLFALDRFDLSGIEALGRLLRTTTFRFTLLYVLVFAVAVSGLGFYFYRTTFGVVDRQTDVIIDQDMQVLADVFVNDGAGALRRLMQERTAWRNDGLYLLIRAPSGAVLSGNLTALPTEALAAAEGFFDFSYERARVDAAGREVGVETRNARGKLRRFKSAPDEETSFLVFVARDISGQEALRQRSQSQMARIAVASIGLGLLIGLAFTRSLMQRVDAVNRTALAIRDGDLSKRIALSGGGDELDHLSANLNAMLDQIERLMNGMRQVSDNIAHDLRSPLTRIRARLNDAIMSSAEDKDAALQATLEDAERMITTFNALLSIARIESGEGAGAMEAVDLAAIADEMTELYEPAAQDAGFVLKLTTSPAPPVRGSRALIGQALANMLDNALKYATGGTTIEVRVARLGEARVVLSVIDDGPGIPPENREAVLKRFVRLERSRTSPGSGLGLSLVSAIARAHGARLTLRDGAPTPAPLAVSSSSTPASLSPSPSGAPSSVAPPAGAVAVLEASGSSPEFGPQSGDKVSILPKITGRGLAVEIAFPAIDRPQ